MCRKGVRQMSFVKVHVTDYWRRGISLEISIHKYAAKRSILFDINKKSHVICTEHQ